MSSTITHSLDHILTLNRRPVKELDPDKKYAEIGIYSFGRGIFHKEPRTGFEVGNKKLYLIKEGDFILHVTFSWEGAIGLAAEAEGGMYGSTRFPTFRVNTDICYPKYLFHYFRTESGVRQLSRISSGSAGRNRVLSIKRIAEISIDLPQLEEQRRIVARIEALAGKVEEARRLREEGTAETEQVWKSAARKLILEETDAKVCKIGDLVKMVGGGTPSKRNEAYWGGSIPWFSPKDMKLRELYDSKDHITELATENSSAKIRPVGSVLIVVRGMILVHTVPSAVLRVPSTVNQDIKVLIPDERLIPEYLCNVLWALNNDLLELIERSTHGTCKLLTPKLLGFEIPVPSINKQQSIVAHLDHLKAKVDNVRRHQFATQRELDALLPAILDKAFKGELSKPIARDSCRIANGEN